jgi:anthranilate phosphoribosyltransferase
MKGETTDEIAGAASVMRKKATPISPTLGNGDLMIDTCGTGGDSSGTFNISTASALVAAGAGAIVAKHGNRSISSRCGSADVLEALGVAIDIGPDKVARCIETVGIGFLFAPGLHGAMKHAIGPRRELGIRTIFNILGPLTNPAGAGAQLLGVYDPNLCVVMAEVLKSLGSVRAMVVHGSGMDEISISGPTDLAVLEDEIVSRRRIVPEDLGIERASIEELMGGDAVENARIIRDILSGETGPRRDVVIVNSAASLMVAGIAEDFSDGIEKAAESIDSKKARDKLDELISFTGGVH